MSYSQANYANHNAIFTPINFLPQELIQPKLRQDVMTSIKEDLPSYEKFLQLSSNEQEALIEYCMGNRGLKITFDPFFQNIFNPQKHPKRLSRLISSVLGQPVTIRCILPREGIRLSDSSSLMIMDVLVELTDGKSGECGNPTTWLLFSYATFLLLWG